MMKHNFSRASLFLLIVISQSDAFAAKVDGFLEGEEEIASKSRKTTKMKELESAIKVEDSIENSLSYKHLSDRIKVPGFMTASQIPRVATVIGPDRAYGMFRLGDRIFLRWTGSPAPKVDNLYEIYTPTLVTQNESVATDFSVLVRPSPRNQIKSGYRLVGYYYDSNASIRIRKVSQGLVEGVLETMRGAVDINDELMPYLPMVDRILPISGVAGSSAMVIGGSPPDRVSTTLGSILYLNRGHRDGIRIGQMYESLESIPLSGVTGLAPEESHGTIKVIYVSDSFSTAIVDEQFDVIRVGSILKAKQDLNSRTDGPMPLASKPVEIRKAKELPSARGSLSELDYLEKTRSTRTLSDGEMERLKILGDQKKHSLETATPTEANLENPALPAIDTFSATKTDKSKKKKETGKKDSKDKTTDEENLNELILQN